MHIFSMNAMQDLVLCTHKRKVPSMLTCSTEGDYKDVTCERLQADSQLLLRQLLRHMER